MEKDFDAWNAMKKRIHHSESDNKYFSQREIWWCGLGVNIGDEEDGKHELFDRPVLILRIFNRHLAWVIPSTSNRKSGIYYYQYDHGHMSYSFILSQLRLVSTRRLLRKICTIPEAQWNEIRERVRILI